MRVAVVSDAVHPFHKGGKEERLHALTSRLSRHGVEAHVFTMRWWDGPTEHREGDVVLHAMAPYVPLYAGSRRSIRQGVVFAVSCLRMLRERFDVLEADAIPFLHLFPLRVVATIKRRPFVVTWHEVWGQAYWRRYLGPLGSVASFCERRAVALPDVIVAASSGTAERLAEVSRGRAHVVVVPNGVDRAEIDRVEPAVDAADLLCVGRLLAHKNVHVLLEALSVLHGRGVRLSLDVIGQGPEETRLRGLAHRLGLAASVRFRGALDRRGDVLALMKSTSVLAFPSEREGFGMVALEALACGTPVVTSDAEDNFARALIRPGVDGEVCPARPEELADAIERVLAELPARRRGAAERAASFDWDALAAGLAEVYRP
ncbi:glycosyltransferase family 4 protein [Motilibacter aurantiacus]|uniref:glycosyltransferase family 4 protein n=1 Tax=Motilibacter aurantiacus TaxID=2714955 RepID=UPI00140BABE1|nr:glycosyltransferase family 4 protein [Motilibacter aurantiacus]